MSDFVSPASLKVILEGPNNTLHLDGTQKKFKEYASFQVTTGDGSKGL